MTVEHAFLTARIKKYRPTVDLLDQGADKIAFLYVVLHIPFRRTVSLEHISVG